MEFVTRNKSQLTKMVMMLVLAVVLLFSFVGLARELVVTSTADSGSGTLRWALETTRSGDIITFDPDVFPPDDPATIYPRSELPPISCGHLTIDASNAGVILDGSEMGGDWGIGLEIRSDENAIYGLQIVNFFPGAGIALSKYAKDNVIGGSRNIGSGPLGRGNLCSGNGIGINLNGPGVSHNTISSNFIGIDTAGAEPWGNQTGIYVLRGASYNMIGPDNIIAFNKEEGIQIYNPSSLFNTITSNSIHSNGVFGILLNEDGNGNLPTPSVASADFQAGNLSGNTCANCIVEIFSDRGSEGAIYEGRAVADENGHFSFEKGKPFAGRNVTLTATAVNGNTSGFATAVSSTNTPSIAQEESPRELVVTSTADSGSGSLRWALQMAQPSDKILFDARVFPPNSPATIYLQSPLPPIMQGNVSIDASDAGVIIDGSHIKGGQGANGLQIPSSGNTIQGLQIINFSGSGIVLGGGAQGNVIGGDRAAGSGPVGQGNLVCANDIGIDLCDVGTSHNVILGNLVGVHADGTTPCGNRVSGIFIEPGATRNVIGPNNIITCNLGDGVTVMCSDSYGNTITRNSIYKNGVGDTTDIALREGGNAALAAPVISEFYMGSGTLIGTAAPGSTIEIFSGHRQGEIYEGTAISDTEGSFSFRKAAPFSGPYLTCTATDSAGNTSSFSLPIYITALLQEGSTLSRTLLQPKESHELADNRIGAMWNGFWQPFDMMYVAKTQITGLGLKRARLTINSLEQITAGEYVADMSQPEMSVIPVHDALFTMVADAGVQITYTLTFWDKESPYTEDVLSGPRFKAEDQIQRYLDFVRFIVSHFKDRVQYFEIWNEPDLGTPGQRIDVADYIDLVKRAALVIRHEYPEVKIQVGGTTSLHDSREYLFSILRSDIMPLVDVVSWHPLFGESPEHEAEYYYSCPSIVEQIKEVASSHGFQGEYEADELTWSVHGQGGDAPWRYSNTRAAKYYARAIVQHLGMDIAVSLGGVSQRPIIFPTIQNLCTVMAGHEAIDLPVEIDIDYNGPGAYCVFRYPNGDRMMAVWTDGIAQDEDPGIPATITFPGLTAGSVTGIDVLHGFEQELVFETYGDSTTIRDLLVKDYPILIRLSDVTMGLDYEETVGDGFHQLGNVDAVPSSTGGGSDRDGDGVPDSADYCPDWPGSKEANGC